MKTDSEILREIAVDISNGRLLSRGTGIYLKKLDDKLQQQEVSEEDIELELRRSYDVSHPSDTNKAIGFVHGIHWLTKKLKGNGI